MAVTTSLAFSHHLYFALHHGWAITAAIGTRKGQVNPI